MPGRRGVAALLCLALGPAARGAEPPLLVVTSHFPPYVLCAPESGGGEAARGGIDVGIVEEAFRRAGLAVSIQCLPWKRALAVASAGKAAAVFPGFRTPEREAFALFLGEPLHVSQYSLFVKRGAELRFTGLPDLRGRRIGIERAHDISPAFDEAVRAGWFQVEEASSPEQNLRKLLAGHVDAYINNHHVVQHVARELGLQDRIAQLPEPVARGKPSYLLIARAGALASRPAEVGRLDEALRSMWRDGTVERLTAQRIAAGFSPPAAPALPGR